MYNKWSSRIIAAGDTVTDEIQGNTMDLHINEMKTATSIKHISNVLSIEM